MAAFLKLDGDVFCFCRRYFLTS
ncbi:hypothetical protein CCACVL1_21110 [Corchorus capsularis]|uniref:Uncharacterized protein n=1 Tax=Corchorus capsularis TaxID=210143 RepID=A0A1R3H847_COCAP|nr:hypothetical protein CCACVL1_21110 [Corchorus capsularis]